jgi:DNA-directed RNA polymerase specialized sigma54-like protein
MSKEERNQKINHLDHIRHGYGLKEIADNLEIHYTTVSKIVKKRDENYNSGHYGSKSVFIPNSWARSLASFSKRLA